jgi:zinc transporter 1
VHELHIWRLNQKKSLASAHLVLENDDDLEFHKLAKTVNECFHAYGIHSVTLQPESRTGDKKDTSVTRVVSQGLEEGADGQGTTERCQLLCGNVCTDLSCCEQIQDGGKFLL